MSKKDVWAVHSACLECCSVFVQKQGKFAVYCLSDVNQVPQRFWTELLHLLKVELEY